MIDHGKIFEQGTHDELMAKQARTTSSTRHSSAGYPKIKKFSQNCLSFLQGKAVFFPLFYNWFSFP